MTNGAAYLEGKTAYHANVLFSACPYKRDTTEWQWWRAGWVDAFNKKAVDNSTQMAS